MQNKRGEHPHVLAVVPHFSATPDLLESVVESVAGQRSTANVSLVIVANNPELAPALSFKGIPAVRIIRPGYNLGYAGALEVARRTVSSDYFWVLQEDTIPNSDCLEILLSGFVSGHDTNPFAVITPDALVSAESKPSRVRGQVWNMDAGEKSTSLKSDGASEITQFFGWSPQNAPFVYLSGALLSSSALERIGGFDASFWPLGYVDADTCFRLLKAGYAIGLSSRAHITHLTRTPDTSHPFAWKRVSLQTNKQRFLSLHGTDSPPTYERSTAIDAEIAQGIAIGMSQYIDNYVRHIKPQDKTVRGVLGRLLRRLIP